MQDDCKRGHTPIMRGITTAQAKQVELEGGGTPVRCRAIDFQVMYIASRWLSAAFATADSLLPVTRTGRPSAECSTKTT